MALLTCSVAQAAEDKEEDVPLDKVPQVVKDAAAKAVPGIKLTEAEKEIKGSNVIYELEGKVGDKEYELKITSTGKVLKVELEDDDDEDDDDDDDEDDDDDDD